MSDFVPAQHLARDGDRMNLAVLQRIDKEIEKILFSAGHTALYGYNTETRQWASKDVEGSTFLVQRMSAPFHQLLVLNKKSANNFREDIDVEAFQFEVSGPYIMYENAQREVGGMWLYDTKLIPLMVAALEGMKAAHVALQAQRQAAQAIISSSSSVGGHLPGPPAAAPANQGAEAAFWAMLGQASQAQPSPSPQLLAGPAFPAASGSPAPSSIANSNMARLFGSARPAPTAAPPSTQQHPQNPSSPPNPPQPPAPLQQAPSPVPAASPSPQKPQRDPSSPQKPQRDPSVQPGLQAQAPHSPPPTQTASSLGQNPLISLLDEPQAPGVAGPTAANGAANPALKSAGPAPAAAAPDLLTPSFFRQSANLGPASSPPREAPIQPTTTTRAQSLGQQGTATHRPAASGTGPSSTPSQPVQQQQPQRPPQGDGLSHLFARAKGVHTTPAANGDPPSAAVNHRDTTRPPDAPGDRPLSEPGDGTGHGSSNSSSAHSAVRAAMHALADDDNFINLVLSKLQPVLQP